MGSSLVHQNPEGHVKHAVCPAEFAHDPVEETEQLSSLWDRLRISRAESRWVRRFRGPA